MIELRWMDLSGKMSPDSEICFMWFSCVCERCLTVGPRWTVSSARKVDDEFYMMVSDFFDKNRVDTVEHVEQTMKHLTKKYKKKKK